jgi:hypothetical protein
MTHRPGRRLSVVFVLALVLAFGVSAAALASGLSKPVLKAPGRNGKVHIGSIVFKVFDPGVPKDVSPLDIAIGPNKSDVTRLSLLKGLPKSCKSKCDFVAMKPLKGHPGTWIYKVPKSLQFPGFWANTPGRYYWQAEHVAPLCQAPHCEVMSPIRSFRVVH